MAQAEVETGPDHGDEIDFTFDGGADQIDMDDFDFELDGGEVLQGEIASGDQQASEDFVVGQEEVGEADEISYEDTAEMESQQDIGKDVSNTTSAEVAEKAMEQGRPSEEIDYAQETPMDDLTRTHASAQDIQPDYVSFEASAFDVVLENPGVSIEASLEDMSAVRDVRAAIMPEPAVGDFELLPTDAGADSDAGVIDALEGLDELEHSFDAGEGMVMPDGSAGLPFEEDATSTNNTDSYRNEGEARGALSDSLGKYATQVPAISVTWGDDNCSLFKVPGSEDPESFYLEDVSLINKPLSALLSGMRRSISSYVSEEQEIYIKITELGLEFGETTTPALLDTVTMHNLLALHESLAKNDDPMADPSLHFELTTKLNCTLRVPQLVNAAKEGKGLSAFQSFPSATHVSEDSADNNTGSYKGTSEGDESAAADQEDQEVGEDDFEESYEKEEDEAREQPDDNESEQLNDGDMEGELPADPSPEDEDDEDLIDYEDHEGVDASVEVAAEYTAETGNDLSVDATDGAPHVDQDTAPLETAQLGGHDAGESSHEFGGEGAAYSEVQEHAVDAGAAMYEEIDYDEDHPLAEDTYHTELDGNDYARINASINDVLPTTTGVTDTAEPDEPGVNTSLSEQARLKSDDNDDEYLDLGDSGANENGLEFQTDAAGPPGLSSQPTSASNTLNGDEVEYQSRSVAHLPSAANDNAVANAEADFDEIDWEDNDKIVPATQPGSTPTSMTGKRTREEDEPEEVLDDGHDAKRQRP